MTNLFVEVVLLCTRKIERLLLNEYDYVSISLIKCAAIDLLSTLLFEDGNRFCTREHLAV